MVNPPQSADARHEWLAEASAILQAWQASKGGSVLPAMESADLVARIATALQAAYERTKLGELQPDR
jgi:hypothetical protein